MTFTPYPKFNWWTGSNGNLFMDVAGYRYSAGKANDGSGYWVARNGKEIGSGFLSIETAKAVAESDAQIEHGE